MTFILAGALLSLLALAGAGRLAWRGAAPHGTLLLASGAPLVSLVIFLLLSLGLAAPAVAIAVCLAFALAVPWRGLRWTWPAWPALLLAPFFVFYAVHALAPEIQPDAAGYHLGLVAAWARTHGFVFQNGFYDILPLGLETLFLPAFLIGAHSAAKLVHFFLLCATVPLICHIGARFGLNRVQRLAAAGLYVLTPVVAVAGTSAYNDAAEVFFSLAAFALLVENHFEPDRKTLFHAGLAAGFCYAIKSPGLVVVAGALVWMLARKQWRGAMAVGAGAAVSVVPWMGRALVLTGNPLAPLGNALFPNDAFHLAGEHALATYLHSYGGVGWSQIPWALAIDGARLQGLTGPLIFLLPLALLALRRPAGRALLAGTAVLLLPWTQNIGARFLLPGLALAALALVYALPRRAALLLLVAQAVVCWPGVVDRYSQSNAWRLHGWPWRAALRIQPEEAYLKENLYEYRFTRRVAARLKDGEPLLDFHGLPFAYLNTVPAGPQPTRRFDNIALAFDQANVAMPASLRATACAFPLQFVRAVRVRLERPWPGAWSLAELTATRRGVNVPVSPAWFLKAWPEPADAALAVDGLRATRWSTVVQAQPGMYWELRFDRPQPIDAVTAWLPDDGSIASSAVYIQALDRRWMRVSDAASRASSVRRLFRRDVTRSARAQGFEWIAIQVGDGSRGALGTALFAMPDAWGVELVERVGDMALFRILP